MSNTLVTPFDLADFPGAPFDDIMVDIAAAQVRAEAGWHIAPVVTETLRINTWGGYDLRIPSLRIVSISEIRVDGVAYDASDWSAIPYGIYRYAGWPTGVVEVDLVHGFDDTPLDLLPVLEHGKLGREVLRLAGCPSWLRAGGTP